MAVTSPAKVERTRYESIAQVNATANQQISRAESDEALGQPIVPLNTGKKYVFRSRPGTLRGFSVRIPTLPDDFANEKQEKRYTERFNKRREMYDKDAKYSLDAVREAVGGEYIMFSKIPGNANRQTTCFYATDNEDVFQFLMAIRKRSKSENWKNIMIEYPTRMVDINGVKVPATAAGWEAAQAAILADPDED